MSDMRHNRVVERREHRRALRRAVLSAVLATAIGAGSGYAIAFSPLAGWIVVGIGGAVALTLWVESRAGRAATAPPVAQFLFAAQSED